MAFSPGSESGPDGALNDLRRGGDQLLLGPQERLSHVDLPGLALLRHPSSSSSSSPLIHAGGPAHRRPVSGWREQLLQFRRQASTGRGHLVGVLVHVFVSRRSGEQNHQNQQNQQNQSPSSQTCFGDL